jgi:hypothetical protein
MVRIVFLFWIDGCQVGNKDLKQKRENKWQKKSKRQIANRIRMK